LKKLKLAVNGRDFYCLYSFTEKILNIELAKTVLLERQSFETVAYLLYLDGLKKDGRSMKQLIEGPTPSFDFKTSARVHVDDCASLKVKLSEDMKIGSTGDLSFSSDRKGKRVIKPIEEGEKEYYIGGNEFYVHYPLAEE
jgi:hypothetical protein